MNSWWWLCWLVVLIDGAVLPKRVTPAFLDWLCDGMPSTHCLPLQTDFRYYQLPPGSVRVLDENHQLPAPVLRKRDGTILTPSVWRNPAGSVPLNTTARSHSKPRSFKGFREARRSRDDGQQHRFAAVNRTFPALEPALMDLSDQCYVSQSRKSKGYCEPAYLMAGCTKCMSTSLWNYLGAHPNIAETPKIKEIQWDDRWKYLPRMRADSGRLAGWSNPLFMYEGMKNLPAKIQKANPKIKLIFVLRDPVDRIISNYIFAGSFGGLISNSSVLHWPPEMYFSSEWAFLYDCWNKGRDFDDCDQFYLQDSWPYDVFKARRRQFVAASLYYHVLRDWYTVFDAEQILIVKYEYLKTQPVEAMNGVFSFLGVAPIAEWMDLKARNTRPTIANYTFEMPSEAFLKGMRKFFTPHNRMLYDLLGVKWDW